MKIITTPLIIATLSLTYAFPAIAQEPLSRIGFGSCVKEDQKQPIWDAVVAAEPQQFIFLGDNIYGDTEDMAVLKAKWDTLRANPGFQKLKATCPLLGTWDDHDYGKDDAGLEYPKREESQQIFLDFFDEPQGTTRRTTPGIYDAKIFGPEGKRVQIILLDTRYFRSPLKPGKPETEPGEGRSGLYLPDLSPDATMLGEAQWAWLKEQLQVPAQVRIIASSIQAVQDDVTWEKWGNFPLERERLFRLIGTTSAEGVIIISGDRHTAEINRLDENVPYPIFDITSSSLNRPSQGFRNELGRHRVGVMYSKENFGMITIDWSQPDPTVRMQVRDIEGKTVLQSRTPLSRLRPE